MIVWLFRARANALAIRDHGQRWGRPWLIFGWFVPVMDLWVPKQIVDDIWSASEPAQDGRQGIRKPLLVTAWWTAFLLYGVASYFVARIQLRGDLASLHDAARNTVFISPLGILAAVLAAVVVWKIGRFQEEEAVRIAAAPA
jgi:Na+/proline symporter